MASVKQQIKTLQERMEAEARVFHELKGDISKLAHQRQQLQQQFGENDMVLKELERLADDSNVYKLIGPVLVKQDPLEAKSNVTKRLEYIKGESDRVEAQLKTLESKQSDKQKELMSLQGKLQELVAGAAR